MMTTGEANNLCRISQRAQTRVAKAQTSAAVAHDPVLERQPGASWLSVWQWGQVPWDLWQCCAEHRHGEVGSAPSKVRKDEA